MRLGAAARVCGLSEKTLRRYIHAGILPATVLRIGRVSHYEVNAVDVATLPARDVPDAHDRDAMLAFLSATRERMDRIEGMILRLYEDSHKSNGPTLITLDRCAIIARAHGVGYWTARKDWKWSAQERADEKTALATIFTRAKTRFTECLDTECACHAL